jgi:hypothetical protein
MSSSPVGLRKKPERLLGGAPIRPPLAVSAAALAGDTGSGLHSPPVAAVCSSPGPASPSLCCSSSSRRGGAAPGRASPEPAAAASAGSAASRPGGEGDGLGTEEGGSALSASGGGGDGAGGSGGRGGAGMSGSSPVSSPGANRVERAYWMSPTATDRTRDTAREGARRSISSSPPPDCRGARPAISAGPAAACAATARGSVARWLTRACPSPPGMRS